MRVSRGGPWARPAAMLFIEPPLCRHGYTDECSVGSAFGAVHTSARASISSLLVRARAPNSSRSCGLSSRPASDTILPNNKSKDPGNISNDIRGRPTPQTPEATATTETGTRVIILQSQKQGAINDKSDNSNKGSTSKNRTFRAGALSKTSLNNKRHKQPTATTELLC